MACLVSDLRSSAPRISLASNPSVVTSSMTSMASSANIDPSKGSRDRELYITRDFRHSRALQELKTALYDGKTTNQYLIVRGVDEKIMNLIEERGYEGVRYEWHGDLQLLIVKVPTKAHETASQEFGAIIHRGCWVNGTQSTRAQINRRKHFPRTLKISQKRTQLVNENQDRPTQS